MSLFGRNKNIFLHAMTIVAFLMVSGSFAQNKAALNRRITDLEKRVRILENRLNKALNPAKTKNYVKSRPAPGRKQIQAQPVVTPKYVGYPIKAKLVKKELKLAQPGEVDDNLALLITFRNHGNKDIVSFKGDILFKTTQGDSIMSFWADINKTIRVNEGNSWFGGIAYKASDNSHRRLLNMGIYDITVEVKLEEICCSDGTCKKAKK